MPQFELTRTIYIPPIQGKLADIDILKCQRMNNIGIFKIHFLRFRQ